MKYVFLFATLAAVYFFWAHRAALAPVTAEITQQEAAPLTTGPRDPAAAATPAAPAERTNALKRPIDRTREVLNQVKQRNGSGEF